MSERYIQRFTLPGQSYPLGCPVRLEGARLLEDTKTPRLVAQCKFVPVTGGVMALRVILQCTGENGADLGTVSFAYRDRAARGRGFGQYSAIVLPAGTRAFTVEVVGAVLLTGKSWSRAAAKAAEATRQAPPVKPAQPAPSIEPSRPEPAEPTQLPTGAPAKKPGGKAIGMVAVVALVVILAVVLLPKLIHSTPQDNKPSQNGPVSAGDDRTPADPNRGVTGSSAEENKPSPAGPAGPAGPADPAGPAGPASPAASPGPQSVQSADFGETGDITRIYLQRDPNGYYYLNPESVSSYMPNVTTVCSQMDRGVTEDLMTDLKESFTFAWLVGMADPVTYGLSSDWTMYPKQDGTPAQVCILAFDDRTLSLVGYYMGVPEQYDENTIYIDMIHCDYALGPLFEQERMAFEEGRDLLFQNYLDAGSDLRAAGARYYLWGYNTSFSDRPQDDEIQGYHLWEQLNSPYVADLVRDIDHLELRLAQGNRGKPDSHMLFLLLDEHYQVVGFTYMP